MLGGRAWVERLERSDTHRRLQHRREHGITGDASKRMADIAVEWGGGVRQRVVQQRRKLFPQDRLQGQHGNCKLAAGPWWCTEGRHRKAPTNGARLPQ